MSSVKHFYAIVDFAGHKGTAVQYVNEASQPGNPWITMVPIPYKNVDQGLPTGPLKFESKEDAQAMLDKVKAQALRDWDNNQHIYMRYPDRARPQWKVYKFKEDEVIYN